MHLRLLPDIMPGAPWLLLLALLWGQLFLASSYGWTYGNYYDYGWYVPPLTLLFCYRALAGEEKLSPPFSGAAGPVFLIGGLVAVLMPLRILEKVDQSWTLPLWVHAAVVVVVSFILFGRMGGRQLAWRMVPVVIFALTAIRLPSVVEASLVRTMTALVVESSSWILGLMGREVTVVGSQLELDGLKVHVTEGCSGIRSIQSFLMVSLFFGEWMLLSVRRRLWMIAWGVGVAWALNVARTCALALIRFEQGQQAFEKAHDTLGLVAFALGSLILLMVSSRLGSSHEEGLEVRKSMIKEAR